MHQRHDKKRRKHTTLCVRTHMLSKIETAVKLNAKLV